jgi:mannose-1-phosphate guanylyltransferase
MSRGTWAVVLAGGRGTRFWPRSRKDSPKQLLALEGPRTLLQATVARVAPLVPPDRVLVVTSEDLVEAVRQQLPEVPADNVLAEPRGRNTAPAIGWAAVEVELRGGDLTIVLPSDHRVADEAAFVACLAAAEAAARETGALLLLGMRPDRPHTGYGYIRAGETRHEWGGRAVHPVERFVEKPDRAGAIKLVAEGALWNGGMFVWTTAAIRAAFERHLPITAQALDAISRGVPVQEVWDGTDATSIDYGVLERETNLLVVPCEAGWSDLGAWSAMEGVFPDTELGAARAGQVVGLDAAGNIVDAPDKLVAMIGTNDLVVVDAGDVLLVAAKDQASRIPELLRLLEARGLGKYL